MVVLKRFWSIIIPRTNYEATILMTRIHILGTPSSMVYGPYQLPDQIWSDIGNGVRLVRQLVIIVRLLHFFNLAVTTEVTATPFRLIETPFNSIPRQKICS